MWQYNCQTSTYQIDYARQAMQQQAMQSSQRQHQMYLDNVNAYQNKQRAEENYRLGIGLTDSQRIERDNQIKEAAEKKAKEEKDRVYWDDWNKKQNQEAYNTRELKRKSIEAAQKRENEKLMLEQKSKRIEQKKQEQETKKLELEKHEQDKKKLEVEKREQKLQKNTNNHGKCKPNNKNTESVADPKTNECCSTCNIL